MDINTIKHYKFICSTLIWSFYNIINLRYFNNVKIDKKCKFIGKLIIWKTTNSIIHIGEKCTFISNSNTKNLVGINRPCIITTQDKNAKIEIGNNCGFSGTVISSAISITIKDNVKCGANTQIMDSNWHPEDPRSGIPKPIIIEQNVWLGLNVTVLKGVTIGENTVIGANSTVTKSIPANVVAAGNPCRVIREL